MELANARGKEGPRSVREEVARPNAGNLLRRLGDRLADALATRTEKEEGGLAIVPLHIGYIQDKAQNHALCRSGLLGPGQKRMFADACCVQAGQGGLMEGREQWFFILPLQLREEALQLSGKKDYSKLWKAIANLNAQMGLPQIGHLEQIVSKQRAYLTQFQSRFELLTGQTGALFFLKDRLAGLELAPTSAYFREVWMPLVCFCYGTAAMEAEKKSERCAAALPPFSAKSLPELRSQLQESRLQAQTRVRAWLACTPRETFEKSEQERYLNFRLQTAHGKNFTGQLVEEEGRLVYASIFARAKYLSEAA
jgi:hypothetical protein